MHPTLGNALMVIGFVAEADRKKAERHAKLGKTCTHCGAINHFPLAVIAKCGLCGTAL